MTWRQRIGLRTAEDVQAAYERGYQDALLSVQQDLTALRHEASVLFAEAKFNRALAMDRLHILEQELRKP